MMKQSKYLNNLVDALTILPGIGKKSAQRMAYKLMRSANEKTLNLSEKLSDITTKVASCSICGIYLDLSDTVMQNDQATASFASKKIVMLVRYVLLNHQRMFTLLMQVLIIKVIILYSMEIYLLLMEEVPRR